MKEKMTYEEFTTLPEFDSKTRTDILIILEKRPMQVVEIAKELKKHPKTVNYHLKKLKDKITSRRKGKEVYYGLKSKVEE